MSSSGRNSENIQLACTRVCTYEEYVNVNTKRVTVCAHVCTHVRIYTCTRENAVVYVYVHDLGERERESSESLLPLAVGIAVTSYIVG